MFNFKNLAVIGFAALISACGGHDFEGTYESRVVTDNNMVAAMTKGLVGLKVTIGKDYIESEGNRRPLNSIVVRESGGEKYLVMTSGQDEEVMKIVDKNTLEQKQGLATFQLVRVN